MQFANMFETCSEWLLYISEWTLGYSTNMSNVKVTTKVAVSSLLGETSSLQDYGSAIMHNFSTKEVKSVVSFSLPGDPTHFGKEKKIVKVCQRFSQAYQFDDFFEKHFQVLLFFDHTELVGTSCTFHRF